MYNDLRIKVYIWYLHVMPHNSILLRVYLYNDQLIVIVAVIIVL